MQARYLLKVKCHLGVALREVQVSLFLAGVALGEVQV